MAPRRARRSGGPSRRTWIRAGVTRQHHLARPAEQHRAPGGVERRNALLHLVTDVVAQHLWIARDRQVESRGHLRKTSEERSLRFLFALAGVEALTARFRRIVRHDQPVCEREIEASSQQRADDAASGAIRRGQGDEPSVCHEGLLWHESSQTQRPRRRALRPRRPS